MPPTNKVSDKPSRISPLTHRADVNMPAIFILPTVVHLTLSMDKHAGAEQCSSHVGLGVRPTMSNLYSLAKGQSAIRDWFRAPHDRTEHQKEPSLPWGRL
jgi:hypothetical protein